MDTLSSANVESEITHEIPEDYSGDSQSALIVDFVRKRTQLFHDINKEVYATNNTTGETRRIDSRGFKDWLFSELYELTGKAVRDQSMREALTTLTGIGRYKEKCIEVHIRAAKLGEAYYLDLAEPGKSRAIKISEGCWQIVDSTPVRFVRSESMGALPEPVRGGKIDALWSLINIPKESRLLVLAWITDCLRPDTPFPILELNGEQGSAKSTTQTILRRLIDPNACDLRSAPKTVEDVFVGAGANWLCSYENISYLSSAMQDAFCVIATDGGYAKRKLYSDADETVIKAKRPIILNGISIAITAQDLIDRTITVETPVIEDRFDVSKLWEDFHAIQGMLLGALMDIMADALALLPTVTIPKENRPRLVEFAKLGMAVAQATGSTQTAFLEAFNASREESIARTIDASPVATAFLAWHEYKRISNVTMTVNGLFQEITEFKPDGTDSWPKSAKGFGDALRRLAPALRQMGIECKSLGKQGGTVKWSVVTKGN